MARLYQLLCGNLECPSRNSGDVTDGPDGMQVNGRRWGVTASEIPDDGTWLCPDCSTTRAS